MKRESMQSYITGFQLAIIIIAKPPHVVYSESIHMGLRNIARVQRVHNAGKGTLLESAELGMINDYVQHKGTFNRIKEWWSIRDSFLINPDFDNTRCRFDIDNNWTKLG